MGKDKRRGDATQRSDDDGDVYTNAWRFASHVDAHKARPRGDFVPISSCLAIPVFVRGCHTRVGSGPFSVTRLVTASKTRVMLASSPGTTREDVRHMVSKVRIQRAKPSADTFGHSKGATIPECTFSTVCHRML